MKDTIIGLGKPKRVSKSPWECKIRKWAENTQGKQMGRQCPWKANGSRMLKEKEMGQRSLKAI